jgi:predicted kinase
MKSTLILITGHPATGKTTLARKLGQHLRLPTFCKDDGKEILFDRLGSGDRDWIRLLGAASFDLLYWQADVMLNAGLSCIIEANFNPSYANAPWQNLQSRYGFRCIQLLCSAEVEVVMKRYVQRIEDGTRHSGHRGASVTEELRNLLIHHPAQWLDLAGERIAVDTTRFGDEEFEQLVKQVQRLSETC